MTNILPYWRDYWAEMVPLKKWKVEILSDLCWDELRKLPTEEETKKICEWDGWHPILRVHLEMFFRIKKEGSLIDIFRKADR